MGLLGELFTEFFQLEVNTLSLLLERIAVLADFPKLDINLRAILLP